MCVRNSLQRLKGGRGVLYNHCHGNVSPLNTSKTLELSDWCQWPLPAVDVVFIRGGAVTGSDRCLKVLGSC